MQICHRSLSDLLNMYSLKELHYTYNGKIGAKAEMLNFLADRLSLFYHYSKKSEMSSVKHGCLQ